MYSVYFQYIYISLTRMLTTARIRPYYCIKDSIQEFEDSLTAQERPLWPPPMIRSLIAFTSLGIIGKEDNIAVKS